jgi:hypothetical protein
MFFYPESSVWLLSSLASLQHLTLGQSSCVNREAYDYSITFRSGRCVCKRDDVGARSGAPGLWARRGKQGFCSSLRFVGDKDVRQGTTQLAGVGA